MKYNYQFLQRPAKLCLAVLWLVIISNLALAQSRANVTPVQSGGPSLSVQKSVTTIQLDTGPDIAVSPPAVSDTLNTGRQGTKQLTISNPGTDTLIFSAGIVPHYTLSSRSKVLILTPESYPDQARLLFQNAPDIDAEVFPRNQIASLTLADLQAYDVVFVYNIYPFEGAPGASEVHVGNVLADYVDAGGKVILNASTFFPGIWGIRGRFSDEQYSPFLPSEASSGSNNATLGTVVQPNHPFMAGVAAISYMYSPTVITLAPGTTEIAYWNNGQILLATTPNVAAVNAMPAQQSPGVRPPWEGDLDLMYQNIVRYFKAASVLHVNPVHGKIPPGGQRVIDVHFNATGLDSATYQSSLAIASNAPDALIDVPVSLVVTGNEILFQPDTLAESLHPGQISVRTLTVANNSPDNHTYTVTGVPPYATVSPLSDTLAPGASATLTVSFSTTGLGYGTYPSVIAFNVDSVTWEAPVSLYIYDDPIIEVSAEQLRDTVEYQGEAVQTFQLHNGGGSTLTYSLQFIDSTTNQSFTAGVPLLEENFDGTVFPPTGWSVTSGTGGTQTWRWSSEFLYNNASFYGNYAGTGKAAMISDGPHDNGKFDARLATPAISTDGFRNFVVQFHLNFQENPLADTLAVEVQVDNGAWQTVVKWFNQSRNTHGNYMSLPAELVSLPLHDFIDTTATTFRVRWRYTSHMLVEAFWYGQVDDVIILGEHRTWLNLHPASGSIPPGGTVTITAGFNAQEEAPGYHDGAVWVSSNDPAVPLVAIPASLYVKSLGNIAFAEDSLTATVIVGDTVVRSLVINNSGQGALGYDFSKTPAIGWPSPDIAVYTTDFEDFPVGTLTGYEGWGNLFGSWHITNTPGIGKRFTVVSRAADFAQSHSVPLGTHDISSVRMDISFPNSNLNFNIASVTQAGTTVAAVRYMGATGEGLQVYAYDSAQGTYEYYNLSVPLPVAGFYLRIDVSRATRQVTVYIDGRLVFTGLAGASDIQKVYLGTLTAGTLHIDNFSLVNGVAPEYARVIAPVTGTLQGGESASIDVTFNALDAVPGIYRDTIMVNTTTEGSTHRVPVRFIVQENVAPVLAAADTVKVTGYSTRNVVFTATDANDEPVTITVTSLPPFVTLLISGNGTTTYTIAPQPGDAGEYDLTVVATDAHGKTDSAVVHLSVSPCEPSAFALRSADILPEETGGARFTLYPVPVTDVLYVDLPAEENGTIRMLIHDVQGHALFVVQNQATAFKGYSISTNKLGLTSGFYYVHIRYANGRHEVKKFLKE